MPFASWPTAQSGYLSVHASDLLGRPTRFVGAENFERLGSDPDLRRVILTTVLIAVLTTALATGAG